MRIDNAHEADGDKMVLSRIFGLRRLNCGVYTDKPLDIVPAKLSCATITQALSVSCLSFLCLPLLSKSFDVFVVCVGFRVKTYHRARLDRNPSR